MVPLLLPLLVTSLTTAEPDYCNITTCPHVEDHTMCVFDTDGPAPMCDTVVTRGITPGDQTTILAVHNRLRAAVQKGEYSQRGLPPAVSLPPLSWDQELATLAQRWADQCMDDSDLCRDVQRFKVGQNVAMIFGQKNWTRAIEECYFTEQLENFNQTSLTYQAPPEDDFGMTDTSKLSQLLWAATTKVGCGYIAVKFWLSEEVGPGDVHAYICNYGPAGNIPGQTMYTKA
ncbi:venom allergen 3-like [Amphibalanus amphitrite]|uniref:venom allergen 3-like n=1 Tax=Amphibalanus amphitrite TaxID=1232801 RepID=UPI001C8FD00C|nr:venom allergen 3-like [Amphibalanus amphitrite]XP_043205563.1 venom allergen 3-like [Amphibalanus amphitrite]